MNNESYIKFPGIRRIAVLALSDLPPQVRMTAEAKVAVNVIAIPRDVNFFGAAEMIFTSQAGKKQKTTIKFLTNQEIPLDNAAFIVETQSNERFLIGAREAPYPKVEIEHSTGGSPADRRATQVTVTFAGRPAIALAWLDENNSLPLR